MTQNIEQRTEVAVKKYERSSDLAEQLCLSDTVVSTPSGSRKSLPRLSREYDAIIQLASDRSDSQYQEIEQKSAAQHDNFEVRFNSQVVYTRQGAWKPNTEITDTEKTHSYEYPSESNQWWCPVLDKIPFNTGSQFDEHQFSLVSGATKEYADLSANMSHYGITAAKTRGEVEGFREEFLDDTDCINAALDGYPYLVMLERGRTYYVRGGVLYSRKFQTVNLNGAKVKLLDNAGDDRKTIWEMDEYSRIIEGVVDGNYQNNISDADNWNVVSDVPFSHGIYTARYQTNNGVSKKATGAYIDKVKSQNTIRSNFVLTSNEQFHGLLEAENSYADHHIYFSGAENVHYEKALVKGICRAESVSLGTAGSEIPDNPSPVDNVGGNVTVFKDVHKSPFFVSGYDEEPVWIQGRKVNQPSYVHFDVVYIDDRDISHLLDGNGRRVAFSNQYLVSMDLLLIRSVVTALSEGAKNGSGAGNAYFVESSEGSQLDIQNCHVYIDATEEGLTQRMGAIRASNDGVINVGSLKTRFTAPGATQLDLLSAYNGDITGTTMDTGQTGGCLFSVSGTNQDSTISFQRMREAHGWDILEKNVRNGARTVSARVQVSEMKHVKMYDKVASEHPDVFNRSRIELSSLDGDGYLVRAPVNGLVGQTVELVGDGKAQRGGDSDIRWKDDLLYRTIEKGEVVEIYLHTDGIWYEKEYKNTRAPRFASGSPIGIYKPLFLGQDYFDTLNQKWYKGFGLGINDWV